MTRFSGERGGRLRRPRETSAAGLLSIRKSLKSPQGLRGREYGGTSTYFLLWRGGARMRHHRPRKGGNEFVRLPPVEKLSHGEDVSYHATPPAKIKKKRG